jgi:hypothetical protein
MGAAEGVTSHGVEATPCAHGPEMSLEVVQNMEQVVDFNSTGEVAERLNAPVLKTGRASRPS